MASSSNTTLSPRPSPPNEQISSRTLHPIYQALDTHNYVKALKLTSGAVGCDWDIVRALRVHALERCGKKREALLLLWELLVKNVVLEDDEKDGANANDTSRRTWSELYSRIESLSDATDMVNDSSLGCDVRLLDAVQRLDRRAYAPIALPKGVDGGAGGAGAGAAASNSNAANNGSKGSSSKSSGKKGSKGKNTKSKKGGASNSSAATAAAKNYYQPITDETVLQTLVVTLKMEGMYDTMSEMYSQAMDALSSTTAKMNKEATEEYKEILEEGVCVHFKAVCDCSLVTPSKNNNDNEGGGLDDNAQERLRVRLPKLQTLLKLTKYYERMQTSSLQLAKLTAQPLHFQWTAISSLWYKESLSGLVDCLDEVQSLLAKSDAKNNEGMAQLQSYILEMMGHTNLDEIATQSNKFKQKMALLPRLAETLSSRMVLQSNNTISENDWDVYLETLLVQDKKQEAMEALLKIQGTSMNSGGNGIDGDGTNKDNVLPQIDDEDTIANHVGSILPYTQRKKLERLAQLSLELGMHKEAEGYYRELLGAFPDQWTYWMGLIDACVKDKTDSPINEEGWKRCHSLAQETLSKVESNQKYALRGPHLMMVELASLQLLHVNHSSEGAATTKEELVISLRNEIYNYGNKFGPIASCCFADVRSYLQTLVREASSSSSSSSGMTIDMNNVSGDIVHVLQWAKELWTNNYQSSLATADGSASKGGDNNISPDEFRERRKKIRTFIFAVQVVYGIASEIDAPLSLEVLKKYAPSISEMVTEWRTSLSFLPGVAPKDGGQKEVLPGDEIILLTTQYLQFQSTCTPSDDDSPTAMSFLLPAAALLEEAMDHSPYNPHLKIAAIGIYSTLHAADRALTIYQDMGVKQIQLDSCSYLIFPTLIRGGLYTFAIKLSSSILRLHGATSKDVREYATRSLRNGLLLKAKEMVTFQREKMRPSLQLLYSKGLVMDAAALMIPSDLVSDGSCALKPRVKPSAASLGAEKGYCGGDEDLARAEQLAIDADMHFNAPSIIHEASQTMNCVDECVFSDNRDMTVNNFEILHRNSYLTQKEVVTDSMRSGHMQGLLTHAIMATGAANAPKKGKIPKPTEETTYRCQSLHHSILRVKEFYKEIDDDVGRILWEGCSQLCEAIIVVINGGGDSNDTLAEREKSATSLIDATVQLVQSAQKAFTSCYSAADKQNPEAGKRVCQLLPKFVVPFYVLLETTASLLSLFGWGKRKRMTKAASGALANLALCFRDLLSDMLQAMTQYRSFDGGNNLNSASEYVEADSIQRVIKEAVSSRDMTLERVDPFLVQIKESLETFDET